MRASRLCSYGSCVESLFPRAALHCSADCLGRYRQGQAYKRREMWTRTRDISGGERLAFAFA